jgi:hypothetical protein
MQEELQSSVPTIASIFGEDLYVENNDLKNFLRMMPVHTTTS